MAKKPKKPKRGGPRKRFVMAYPPAPQQRGVVAPAREKLRYEFQPTVGKQKVLVDQQDSKVCESDRKGKCPVQLAFKDGQAHLRLCRQRRQPGFLVPVASPTEAMEVSKRLCSCWKKKRSFERCVPKGTSLGGR